jgi:hypothetical protein
MRLTPQEDQDAWVSTSLNWRNQLAKPGHYTQNPCRLVRGRLSIADSVLGRSRGTLMGDCESPAVYRLNQWTISYGRADSAQDLLWARVEP